MAKLEQSFDVDAPLDQVWSALIDVQRVAPCLPGAEITERREDGSYAGNFSVKIGPASAAYRGTILIEDADEASHVARMQATGSDKRGQGGAKASIVSTLTEAPGGGTRVEVVTDYSITGRLAAFGRGGMIQDVSNRLLREFASCLQTRLAEQAGTPWAAQGADATPEAPGSTATAEPPAAALQADRESLGEAGQAERAGATPTAPPSPPPVPAPPQPAAAPPIQGVRLVLGVLWDRIDRWVRRRLEGPRAR